MIRIGIIGTGIIASAHTDAISNITDFELVAIAEINEEKAKGYSEKLNIPYYLDYKEMCEKENIDAVIINLPHFLHCEASVFCLERGIHVLCEKPMANTVAECDKMIEASEKSGAKLAIGHVQRFFPAIATVKEYIDNGTLGKLVMINEVRNYFYFDDARPRWFLDKKLSGGGIVMNYGAHTLDKLFYTVGGEVTDIRSSYGNLYSDEFDVEGHANISLKISGVPCSVSFCGYKTFVSNEITYTFTNGAVRIGRDGFEVCEGNSGFRKVEPNASQYAPFEHQLIEFAKFIRGEESITPDGYYSRKIIECIEKIYGDR